MAHLALSLFGTFSATLDGVPITDFRSNKVRALLAYLAAEKTRSHSRESLAGLLWPESPDKAARASLRKALSNLRGALDDHHADPPFLLITRRSLQFNPDSDYSVDVVRFSALTDKARRSRIELEEAVAVYQGEFLEGLSIGDSVAFDDWVLILRERLHRQLMSALRDLSAGYAADGEYKRAIETARRAVNLEPWCEEAQRDLMRWLALSGRRSAALKQFLRAREVLSNELGVKPAPETKDLYQAIKAGSVRALAKRETPSWQAKSPRSRPRLPTQLTPFLGRETEMIEIQQSLATPDRRLLTLVGPGGSGKTRLALAVAEEQAERFTDGVHWAPLATAQSPDAVVSAVAAALGQPFSQPGDLRQQLLSYLGGRHMLLMLDNVEHLLTPADREQVLALLTDILNAAPRLKLLVTSRSRLGVMGEVLFPVGGMSYPKKPETETELDQIAEYGAVKLFVMSAQRTCPDFTLNEGNCADVIRVCRRVHGIPLALVLAASWTRMLSSAEIAAQIPGDLDFLSTDLHGLPERQRSMRVVLDHSWALLSERDREVLAKLSVFEDSFSHTAAQAVTGASLHELRSLIDKSLLQFTSKDLYEVHKLVQQYGAGKLAGSQTNEEAVRDRHSAFYSAAVAQWWKDMQGPRQSIAFSEMAQETDNVYQAWKWTVEHDRVSRLDQAALGFFWFHMAHAIPRKRGADYLGLAADRLKASTGYALNDVAELYSDARPERSNELRVLALVLALHSCLQLWVPGRTEQARELAQQSLALLELLELTDQDLRFERAVVLLLTASLGNRAAQDEQSLSLLRAVGGQPWWIRTALWDLGQDHWIRGRFERAKVVLEESLALTHQLGVPENTAELLRSLGSAAWESGDYGTAEELWHEVLDMLRELEIPPDGLMYLLPANLALFKGRLDEAERLARGCLALGKEIGSLLTTVWGYRRLGQVLMAAGRHEEANASLTKGLEEAEELRWDYESTSTLFYAGMAKLHLGDYEEARALVAECLHTARDHDFLRNVGLGLWAQGRVALAENAFAEAYQALQESIEVLKGFGPRRELGPARADLCVAALGLGQPKEARQHLQTALQMPLQTRDYLSRIDVLPAAALYVLDQGEIA
ncbi:MAG: BTAD domain-containing putative transcriptional regulator, partial [Anaerolineae bacterium]